MSDNYHSITAMKLQDYPKTIAKIRKAILRKQQEIETHQESLTTAEALIRQEIAFNEDLKNDAQRKAEEKLAKAKTDSDYYFHQSAIKELKHSLISLEISLELIRNQFTIAKLEERYAIAQLYLATDFIDLAPETITAGAF